MDMPMPSGSHLKIEIIAGAAMMAVNTGTETSLGEANHRTGDLSRADDAGSGYFLAHWLWGHFWGHFKEF